MNRERIRIAVRSYAGYKGDERPTSFTLGGETLQVEEILDRWYDIDHDYFKVLAGNGKEYLLRHDRNSLEWEAVVSAGRKPC